MTYYNTTQLAEQLKVSRYKLLTAIAKLAIKAAGYAGRETLYDQHAVEELEKYFKGGF